MNTLQMLVSVPTLNKSTYLSVQWSANYNKVTSLTITNPLSDQGICCKYWPSMKDITWRLGLEAMTMVKQEEEDREKEG